MQNLCARCDAAVYFAEAVQAMGKCYHKKCFVCCKSCENTLTELTARENCGRSLDSRTCSEHDGQPFCTYCYKTLFGPKGIGFGVGAGLLSTNSPDELTRYFEEEKGLPFTSTISYGVDNEKSRKVQMISSIQQQFYQPTRTYEEHVEPGIRTVLKHDAPIPTVRAPLSSPQRLICGRCQKTVYDAEKILAAGTVFHKTTCFTCTECNKRLESRTQCEQAGRLFCNSCYARKYGPKGYGHGVGAGVLQLHQ